MWCLCWVYGSLKLSRQWPEGKNSPSHPLSVCLLATVEATVCVLIITSGYITKKSGSLPPQKNFFLSFHLVLSGGASVWAITQEERGKHDKQFDTLLPVLGYVSGKLLSKQTNSTHVYKRHTSSYQWPYVSRPQVNRRGSFSSSLVCLRPSWLRSGNCTLLT